MCRACPRDLLGRCTQATPGYVRDRVQVDTVELARLERRLLGEA